MEKKYGLTLFVDVGILEVDKVHPTMRLVSLIQIFNQTYFKIIMV